MRIYADVNRLPDLLASETSSVILQQGPTPPVGTLTPLNGRFVVPVPEGVPAPSLTVSSRLLDPAGPVPAMYAELARLYQYERILPNALLTSTDLLGVDTAATFPNPPDTPAPSWATRIQTGRAVGPGNGFAPLSLVVLPANTAVAPTRPGLCITSTLDITSATGGAGAQRFAVYWKVYGMSCSHDLMDYTDPTVNAPAVKSLVEVDQNLGGDLRVYLSADNGAGYVRVQRLMPVVTGAPALQLRVAFVNQGATRCYLAAYALMF